MNICKKCKKKIIIKIENFKKNSIFVCKDCRNDNKLYKKKIFDSLELEDDLTSNLKCIYSDNHEIYYKKSSINKILDKKYRKEYSKRLMRKIAQDHMRYNGRKFSESINQNAENTNTPILIEIQKQAAQVAEIDYETDISGHRKFGNNYFKGLAEMHKDFVNDLSNDNIDTYIEKQNNLEKIKKKLELTAELDPDLFKNMPKQDFKEMFKTERDNHFEKEMILRQMPNYDDMPAEYDGPTIMPIRNKQGKFDILHRFKNTNKKFRKY